MMALFHVTREGLFALSALLLSMEADASVTISAVSIWMINSGVLFICHARYLIRYVAASFEWAAVTSPRNQSVSNTVTSAK
jgi:hypothetical protein